MLREGLRLLERQGAEDAARLAALRHAADQGWSDIASGAFDDISEEARKRHEVLIATAIRDATGQQ
ncbi:MAG: hypothetical protein WBG76_04520 [Ornithinimicrobium sp.]